MPRTKHPIGFAAWKSGDMIISKTGTIARLQLKGKPSEPVKLDNVKPGDRIRYNGGGWKSVVEVRQARKKGWRELEFKVRGGSNGFEILNAKQPVLRQTGAKVKLIFLSRINGQMFELTGSPMLWDLEELEQAGARLYNPNRRAVNKKEEVE